MTATTISRASTLNELAAALHAGTPVADVRAILTERAKGSGAAAKRASVALSQLDAGTFGGYVPVAAAIYPPKAEAPAPKAKKVAAPAPAPKKAPEPVAVKAPHHNSVAALRSECFARFDALEASMAATQKRLDAVIAASVRRNF